MAATFEPVSPREFACRQICVERFIFAILYSVAVQFVLLTVFLLLVNFSLLHPVAWVLGTFRLMCSLSTWLAAIPLVAAVILYGVCLAKAFLADGRYCPTRFQQICRGIVQKSTLLVINCVIGFLTGWLYTRFLRDEYRVMFLPAGEEGRFLLNEKYLFLLLGGMFAGVYYFLRNKPERSAVNFPVIQQPRYQQIRTQLYSTVYGSLFLSFVPALVYASFFFTFSSVYFRYKLAATFSGVSLAEESALASFYAILSDVRLLVYCWILFSQILSSMNLMQDLFLIFLTEYRTFPVEKSAMADDREVTLVEALANNQIPIIQQLAALNLFNIAEDSDPSRRGRLYALSIPGGHPYNWRLLSGECIRLIRDYSSELSRSIEGASPAPIRPEIARLRPTASMDAEKILSKQYNESFGIRSLSTTALPQNAPPANQPDVLAKAIDSRLTTLRTTLQTIPGIFYLFGEPKTAKTCHLLSNASQQIIWIVQSLAALATHSIAEDQFGVVQNDLPLIIRTLVQLKQTIDQVGSIQLDVKKIDRNYAALKAATRRSLYRVANAFADYLNDIVLEPADVKALHGFVHYREA